MTEPGREAHPNALPNYQSAVIPRDKLEKYALNPKHVSRAYGSSSGQDKAQVFKSALGFDVSNWELLQQCILDELPYCEAFLRKETAYGFEYTVIISVTGPNLNTAEVLTGWIILHGSDYPRLTTARVITEKEAGYDKYKNDSRK